MSVRWKYVAAVVVLGSALSGELVGQNSARAESAALPITIERTQCYVVCDTLTTTIAGGNVIRHLRGQNLGPGRVPVAVSGADTIAVDVDRLAVLSEALSRFSRSGLPADLRPGVAPCSGVFSAHAPVFTLSWREETRRRTVRIERGCQEPTGLVRTLADAAERATRLDQVPIRRH
jgi:hypothetical protein